MTLTRRGLGIGAAIGLTLLAACAPSDPAQVPQGLHLIDAGPDTGVEAEIDQKVADVTAMLMALVPSVDPVEAARAARVAVTAPLTWARDWRVVDPPLIHNFKVVNGLREKGVCQDFADAMHRVLQAEGLRTLQIHRAIANARNLRLEHATVILTARGQPMEQGVVLDPWRLGQGQLWFGRVSEDARFDWETPESARAYRRQARQQE
ncbi:hypothetical protein [uncultured Marivita sp.]|uniref:hypothetical protein n=1 Tax=uncultured Marivita sp. TaxID=888080 RepID=UPI002639830D|nr:hypothetical protein [uncultured Marivita sp.]